jgi:hypothetical protein
MKRLLLAVAALGMALAPLAHAAAKSVVLVHGALLGWRWADCYQDESHVAPRNIYEWFERRSRGDMRRDWQGVGHFQAVALIFLCPRGR